MASNPLEIVNAGMGAQVESPHLSEVSIMPSAAIADKSRSKLAPSKPVKKPVRAASTKAHGIAHSPVADDHQRLKASKVNAARMDAAVAELKAGKGVKWDPFTR